MKKNRVLSIILSLFIILGGSRTVFAQTKAILYKYPNVGTFTCECEEKNWGDSCRHKYYEYAGDYLLEITYWRLPLEVTMNLLKSLKCD